MDDTQTPTPPKGSTSLAFAMGQLSGRVQELHSSSERQAEALERLPGTIVAVLTPRLDELAKKASEHDRMFGEDRRRIGALEKRQWIWIGGGTAALALVGIIINGHPIKL